MKKTSISSILLLFVIAFSSAQELDLKENKEFAGLGKYVKQAGFSPFGDYFAYSIGDNTLRIFDKNWEKIYEHQGNPESGGGPFAFSPDGEYLAYSRYKGKTDIAIIRLSDQKVVQVIDKHGSYVEHLEYSHDGNYLSTCEQYSKLLLWKRNGELFSLNQTFDEFESYLYESSFSYDDRFLITGDLYGRIRIYEKDGAQFSFFQEINNRKNNCYSITFHPKDYTFITGSTEGLRRYRFQKQQFVFTDSAGRRSDTRNPIEFSPQGSYLAVPSNTQIKVFEMKNDTMELVLSNHRHAESTFGASFSENGQFLTSCSADEKVIVWGVNNVEASDKAIVAGWVIGDLTVAQRRSLNPVVTKKIITATKKSLSAPRDEFEKTLEYNERMAQLSDHTLSILQNEMEKNYNLKGSGNTVSFSLTSLIGYNADLEIYKIKMIDTEAGVRIPVDAAKSLKSHWEKAMIKADKIKKDGMSSYTYENFRLIHPISKKEYEVVPVENPFILRKSGQTSSRVGEMSSSPKILPDTINGNTYALLFATDVYDYFNDLVNPVLDAQTISAELSESYGVITEVVINPSLEETAEKIHEFASREYGEKDNLMVFFAGHGVYDEVFREGYVISKDSKSDDLGKTSYMSHSNLRTMINHIACPHIFLVMDVCFGGTFDPHLTSAHRGAGMYADISTAKFVERKLKYTTRLYLTSGGKDYVPDGRPGFHSPFARRFIESLRNYGGDDGVLTSAEILQFVEKADPQPRFGEFGDNEPGSDFIFVLKKEEV